jgi:hypothetical protein
MADFPGLGQRIATDEAVIAEATNNLAKKSRYAYLVRIVSYNLYVHSLSLIVGSISFRECKQFVSRFLPKETALPSGNPSINN